MVCLSFLMCACFVLSFGCSVVVVACDVSIVVFVFAFVLLCLCYAVIIVVCAYGCAFAQDELHVFFFL